MTTFSLRETAKLASFEGGLIDFTKWLRNEKLLMKNNEPYQEFVDRQLFVYKLKNIKAANKTVCVTRVTIKGLYFLSQKLHGKSRLYK